MTIARLPEVLDTGGDGNRVSESGQPLEYRGDTLAVPVLRHLHRETHPVVDRCQELGDGDPFDGPCVHELPGQGRYFLDPVLRIDDLGTVRALMDILINQNGFQVAEDETGNLQRVVPRLLQRVSVIRIE